MEWLKYPENKPSSSDIDKTFIIRYYYYTSVQKEIHYDKAFYIGGWVCGSLDSVSRDVVTHYMELVEPNK